MSKLNAACLALAVLCSAGAAAAPVPMELSGNGINWSWTSSNVGDSTGMLLLSADVSGSTLGAGDIRLRSFELKANNNFVIKSANPPTATGGAGTWNWIDNANLNANGCSGVGADTNQFCFTAGDVAQSVTDDANFGLSVFFDLSQGVLPEVLHLKVDWARYNPQGSWTVNKGKKTYTPTWDHVGDLISQDFTHTEVPVPGTLGLLGLGLVGLGMVRRRAAA